MELSLFFLFCTLFQICAFSLKLLVEFSNTFGKLFMAGTPTEICKPYSGTINSWFLRNFINMYRYAFLLPVCLSIQWGVFIENSVNGWLVSNTMYCYFKCQCSRVNKECNDMNRTIMCIMQSLKLYAVVRHSI